MREFHGYLLSASCCLPMSKVLELNRFDFTDSWQRGFGSQNSADSGKGAGYLRSTNMALLVVAVGGMLVMEIRSDVVEPRGMLCSQN